MEKPNLLSSDLLDILFEYRNKMYGAYELRRSYPKRIAWALGGMLMFCLLFVVVTVIANAKRTTRVADIATVVELMDYKDEKKPEEPVPPPKKEEVKIKETQYTQPRIVADELVKEEDEIKEVEILEETKIGTANVEGDIDKGIVAPPVEPALNIGNKPNVEKDIDGRFNTVQIEARFPGGNEAWAKYLTSHLNSDIPGQNGAPPAKYKVVVSFIVDKNGNISDVRAENDPGYGTATEAIRVIQKGPKWVPAEQNGQQVVYRQKQAITFEVNQE